MIDLLRREREATYAHDVQPRCPHNAPPSSMKQSRHREPMRTPPTAAIGMALAAATVAVGGASAFLVPTPQQAARASSGLGIGRRSTTSSRPAAHRHRLPPLASTQAQAGEAVEEHDVVVIGSGIGGLCTAAVAATYGLDVAVVESHVHAGGAAHAFVRDGFTFDSGPSLFSGLSQDRSPNPLKHVLDFIGEEVEWLNYDTWGVVLPEGSFAAPIGPEPFKEVIAKYGGPNAQEEWDRLLTRVAPLSVAAMALPPSAIRGDAGVLLTMGYFLRAVLKTIPVGPTLQAPFSAILDEVGVKDPFIRNYLNLLCFLLQGLPVDGTMTAVVAYMLGDWVGTDGPGGSNSDVKLLLDYPKGGTGAIVDALVRGFTRRGGRLHLGKHVEEILLEPPANPNNKPRAVGVRLKGGRTIRARKAVVSNASIWDTAKLLPKGTAPEWEAAAAAVPQLDSFLHLHVGIDAAGLEGLNCHYALVDDWDRGISAPGNVVIVSLPSLLDPSLAPPGCITIHAYTAGNEPYSLYDGLDPKGPEYAKLKAERSEVLWRALEKIIPDVRRRVKVGLAGTPLTHQRFLRRSRGSYGPRIVAGTDAYPSSKPPVEGLQLAGDSVFPGVGIPAVAASGNIAANNLVGVRKHFQMLKTIKM